MQFFQMMLKWNGQRNLLNYVRVQSIVPVELGVSLHILLPSNSEVQPEYPHPLRYLVGNFFGQDFLFGITGGKPLKEMLFPYIRSKNFANGTILNLYRCLFDVSMGLRIRKLRK